jgi:hypothetical protein
MIEILKTVANIAAHPVAALAALASPILAFAPAFAVALDQPFFATAGRRSAPRTRSPQLVAAAEPVVAVPATAQPLAVQWARVMAIIETAQKTSVHARELHEAAAVHLDSVEFSLDRLFDDMCRFVPSTSEMTAARDRLKAGRGVPARAT